MRLTKTAISTLALTTALAACGDNNENNTPDQGPVIIDTDQGTPDMGGDDMGVNKPDSDMNNPDMSEDMGMNTPKCESASILPPETTADYKARILQAIQDKTDLCAEPGLNAISNEVFANQGANSDELSELIMPTDSNIQCDLGAPTSEPNLDLTVVCQPANQELTFDVSNPSSLKISVTSAQLSEQTPVRITFIDFQDIGLNVNDDFTLSANGKDLSSLCMPSGSGQRISCDLATEDLELNTEFTLDLKTAYTGTDDPQQLIVDKTFYTGGDDSFFNRIQSRQQLSK